MVATRVTKEKRSGHLTPWDNGKMCTCNQAVTWTVWGQFRAFTSAVFLYLLIIILIIIEWKLMPLFGHCGLINDMGSSPQPSASLWWASHVVDEATVTSILILIPISIYVCKRNPKLLAPAVTFVDGLYDIYLLNKTFGHVLLILMVFDVTLILPNLLEFKADRQNSCIQGIVYCQFKTENLFAKLLEWNRFSFKRMLLT